jgi:hypothetical protein
MRFVYNRSSLGLVEIPGIWNDFHIDASGGGVNTFIGVCSNKIVSANALQEKGIKDAPN